MKRIAAVLFIAACASSPSGAPSPSGATCPTANAPTYDGFARPFFATYCNGCHSASADSRHGAPTADNFDTEAEIREHAAAIDAESAAGPQATNTDMPDMSGPVHMAPTQAEREQLGQFLACEQQP